MSVLFKVEKCGKFSREPLRKKFMPWSNWIDTEVILTSNELILNPKNKSNNPINIPLREIKDIKEISYYDSPNSLYNCLTLKNETILYLVFGAYIYKSDLQKDFFNKLIGQMGKIKEEEYIKKFKMGFKDYIAPYDEITFQKVAEHFKLDEDYVENEVKKMLNDGIIKGRLVSDRIILREPTPKFEQTVYITIPPRTKLTAINCPNCKAPLDYMPPCKCEHCGVMIELMK